MAKKLSNFFFFFYECEKKLMTMIFFLEMKQNTTHRVESERVSEMLSVSHVRLKSASLFLIFSCQKVFFCWIYFFSLSVFVLFNGKMRKIICWKNLYKVFICCISNHNRHHCKLWSAYSSKKSVSFTHHKVRKYNLKWRKEEDKK